MFENLNTIPWGSYEHAYGSADDLPELLRAIASGDDDGSDLFGNIYHQGTVYSATSVAVPFLAEIIAANQHGPNLEAPRTLLYLFALIAYGSGYQQVHHTLSIFENQDKDELAAALAREKEEVTDAHLAVCRQWPLIRKLMGSSDPRLRQTSLYVAGRLIGIGADAYPVLVERWEQEKDGVARAIALFGMSMLLQVIPTETTSFMASNSFPSPLSAATAEELRPALIARLRRAARNGAPFERWIAADALVARRQDPTLSADELAISWRDSTEALEEWSEFHDSIWFAEHPELRLAIAEARLRIGSDHPRDAFLDIAELATNRALRPRAITTLANLLNHDDGAIRQHAASWLHHAGTSIQTNIQTLLAAGQADRTIRPLLLRPLRLVLPDSDATIRCWLEDILRGNDDTACLHNAELIRESDPASWADLLVLRLTRLLDGEPLCPSRDVPNSAYAQNQRFGSSNKAEDRNNLISALITALSRLSSPEHHFALFERAAIAGCLPAAKCLADHAGQDSRARVCLEACAVTTELPQYFLRNIHHLLARFSEASRQTLIAEAGDRPNADLAEALGPASEIFVPIWREEAARTERVGWTPLRAAKALWTLHHDPEEVLPAIISNLSPLPSHKLAFDLLESLGDAALPALPALEKLRASVPLFDNTIEDDEAALARLDALIARLSRL